MDCGRSLLHKHKAKQRSHKNPCPFSLFSIFQTNHLTPFQIFQTFQNSFLRIKTHLWIFHRWVTLFSSIFGFPSGWWSKHITGLLCCQIVINFKKSTSKNLPADFAYNVLKLLFGCDAFFFQHRGKIFFTPPPAHGLLPEFTAVWLGLVPSQRFLKGQVKVVRINLCAIQPGSLPKQRLIPVCSIAFPSSSGCGRSQGEARSLQTNRSICLPRCLLPDKQNSPR